MPSYFSQFFARNALASAITGAVVVSSLGMSPLTYAQETSAMVRGSVSDMAGNAVAGAEVVITSQSTGIEKRVTTDNQGFYSVRGLPAGVTYDVSVDANGLQKAMTEDLQLAVGQQALPG